MRITYLLPVVSQPRYHKRVAAMQSLGAQPKILAFEREYYQGKPWPNGYESLGFIKHKHYYQRIIPLLRSIPLVHRAIQDSEVVYTFGLDVLLIAWLASLLLPKRIKLVYEVGDIREALLLNNAVGRVLRWVERIFLKRVDLLVVTSQAYVDGYYHGVQRLYDLSYQVIENKLPSQDLPEARVCRNLPGEKPNTLITIGYFGLIRCRRSWEVLREVAIQGKGRFKIYIRGVLMGLEDLEQEIRQTSNIEFGGPYVSPDDLSSIYGLVDLVWVAHYHSKPNIQWARSNRFYEACKFQRPMIAQEETQDGLVVQQNNIGIIIDLRDAQAAIQKILSITLDDIRSWHQNLLALPLSIYLYTNEHEELMSFLRGGSRDKIIRC